LASKSEPVGWSEPGPETIPEPTYWPVVTAFGASVTAMGLAMIWPVTLVGLAILATGLVGWTGALTNDG
jgi:hypothetical protein